MTKSQAPLYSMTGFGRSQDDWQLHRITVEISSVNSRFLDVAFHAPSGMNHLEVDIRRLLSRALQRGKVRCSVRINGTNGSGAPLAVREGNLREYLRLYSEIKETYGLEGSLTAEALLFAPEVVAPAEISTDDAGFQEWIERLLNRALAEMLKMRADEGEWLRAELARMLAKLEDFAGRIADLAPRVKENLRKRLLERLAECRGELALPEERILTEVAVLAERSDISEELVRLGSHVQQFRESLDQGGPCGRRLDFLAQELNREINTIGSKSTEAEIGTLVVYFKEELAKAREQVQNIE